MNPRRRKKRASLVFFEVLVFFYNCHFFLVVVFIRLKRPQEGFRRYREIFSVMHSRILWWLESWQDVFHPSPRFFGCRFVWYFLIKGWLNLNWLNFNKMWGGTANMKHKSVASNQGRIKNKIVDCRVLKKKRGIVDVKKIYINSCAVFFKLCRCVIFVAAA